MRIDRDLVTANLHKAVDLHLQGQRAVAFLYGVGGVFLWLVALGIFSLLASLVFFWFHPSLQYLAILTGLALLAWDVWRRLQLRWQRDADRRRRLAGAEAPSVEDEQADPLDEGPAWRRVLEQSLFLPSRVTAAAILAWQDRWSWDEEAYERATDCCITLLRAPSWLPFARLDPCDSPEDRADLLARLIEVQVVWEQGGGDRLALRINPLFRRDCGVQVVETELATAERGSVDIGGDPFANIGKPVADPDRSAKPPPTSDTIDID